MSNSEEESDGQSSGELGISDDALPDDLQPSEDNPLAEGLDDGETVDDLLDGGKQAEQSEQSEQSEQGADSTGDEGDNEGEPGAS